MALLKIIVFRKRSNYQNSVFRFKVIAVITISFTEENKYMVKGVQKETEEITHYNLLCHTLKPKSYVKKFQIHWLFQKRILELVLNSDPFPSLAHTEYLERKW